MEWHKKLKDTGSPFSQKAKEELIQHMKKLKDPNTKSLKTIEAVGMCLDYPPTLVKITVIIVECVLNHPNKFALLWEIKEKLQGK